jgi:hypothetical protein
LRVAPPHGRCDQEAGQTQGKFPIHQAGRAV